MNKKYLYIGLALVVLLAGLIWLGNNKKASDNSPTNNAAASESAPDAQSTSPESDTKQVSDCETATGDVTITYNDDDFSPHCVKVTSGTSIIWNNDSDSEIQVATDPHPSHTGNREVSNGEFELTVPAGGKATSTLKTTGEHDYHNHLQPSATGVIIVE
jgi:plastocyanin